MKIEIQPECQGCGFEMMAFLGDETVTCANCGCLTHLHGSADAKLTTDRAHREGERAMSDLGKSLTSFKKR